jgi:two-component system chemotaxis response regulator CheY
MSASVFESPASSTDCSSAPKRFLRILYADDVRELRELARLSFSRDGHGIECVVDGVAALSRIKEDSSFDLVITDHHMPNMNGLELVRNLREVGFTGKIMVFSSELNPDVAVEYRKFNVDRILYKPVYPSALRFVLAELFDLPLEKPSK